MSTVPELRRVIADAMVSLGVPCEPYPPDAPSPPCAWVDSVTVSRDQMLYGGTGLATARLTHVGLRNDRESTGTDLEGRIGEISDLLTSYGMRVVEVVSGQTQVGGIDLPAVQYAMTANI